MMGYRYKIISTGNSSSKYGPCEICNKPATEVYHQIEERKYIRPDSKDGWTRYECFDLFGHKDCLENKQKGA